MVYVVAEMLLQAVEQKTAAEHTRVMARHGHALRRNASRVAHRAGAVESYKLQVVHQAEAEGLRL